MKIRLGLVFVLFLKVKKGNLMCVFGDCKLDVFGFFGFLYDRILIFVICSCC